MLNNTLFPMKMIFKKYLNKLNNLQGFCYNKKMLIYKDITPTEKKNETRLFIFIYLKTMF
jgi:hypothetical protein